MTLDQLLIHKHDISEIELTDWLNNVLYKYTGAELLPAIDMYTEMKTIYDMTLYVYINGERIRITDED